MKAVAYLLGFFCAGPLLAFALGVLALGHAIATRNVLRLLYEAALAFVWGLPFIVVVCAGLVVCAFFSRGRFIGSFIVIVLNIVALVIVFRANGLPSSMGEAVFFGPTLISFWLHGQLLLEGRATLP